MEIQKPQPYNTNHKGPGENPQRRLSRKTSDQLKKAPAYKIAKMLNKKLQTYIAVPYTYNVKNTTHVVNDLKEIPYNRNLSLASLDITNMYTNIPTGAQITVIDIACQKNHIENDVKRDIIKLTENIIEQNCFQFCGRTYIQLSAF